MNTSKQTNAVLAVGAVTSVLALAGLLPGTATAAPAAAPPKPHGHPHSQLAAVLPREGERDEISAPAVAGVM
ncbi:MAG TPA: hypothetical protein VMI13_07125 [Solirubrobacteraceae bacterium]|nr:hypothetical protein [Solirubrobacteraceae bacterium]